MVRTLVSLAAPVLYFQGFHSLMVSAYAAINGNAYGGLSWGALGNNGDCACDKKDDLEFNCQWEASGRVGRVAPPHACDGRRRAPPACPGRAY